MLKKLLESRFGIIFLASGGLLALVLLSAALRDFSFHPSVPFSLNLFGGLPASMGSGSPIEIPLWKFLSFGALQLVNFIILLVLMDPQTRKRVLYKIFRFVMTMLGIWMVMNYAYERGSLQQLLSLIPAEGAAVTNSTQPGLPEYVPPQINPWLVFAVSFGIALLLVLLGWFIYTHRPQPSGLHALDEIAGIVRDALQGLQPGSDWDEAILRAYLRMNEVVTAERGLIRQPGNTPGEFARRMERAGLPGEAVATLTRLFEEVRYGARRSSQSDRDLAAAALSAILRACQVDS